MIYLFSKYYTAGIDDYKINLLFIKIDYKSRICYYVIQMLLVHTFLEFVISKVKRHFSFINICLKTKDEKN